MAQGIVEFPGHPQPFLAGLPALLLFPDPGGRGGPLPPDAHGLARAQHHHQPGGQRGQPGQRWRRPVPEQVAQPGEDGEPGHRRDDGGQPVTAGGGGVVGDHQGQPDSPAGVPEPEVDQGGPEHPGQNRHRIPPPQRQRPGRRDDQGDGPGVDAPMAGLMPCGEVGAHRQHGGQRRRQGAIGDQARPAGRCPLGAAVHRGHKHERRRAPPIRRRLQGAAAATPPVVAGRAAPGSRPPSGAGCKPPPARRHPTVPVPNVGGEPPDRLTGRNRLVISRQRIPAQAVAGIVETGARGQAGDRGLESADGPLRRVFECDAVFP